MLHHPMERGGERVKDQAPKKHLTNKAHKMKPPYTLPGTTGFTTETGDWQCTGSMMGRATIIPSDYNGEKLHLRRVPMDSDGYDPGGAYWGKGTPLYCTFGETETEPLQVFVRAPSRKEAIAKLQTLITSPRFFRP